MESVSIQPKPKKGLEEEIADNQPKKEQVSIQPKPKKGLEVKALKVKHGTLYLFQSSRSRRRV